MIEFFDSSAKLVGHSGSILLPDDDEITRKLAMLFEGQCEGLGPTQAARKFGYTKQRYFQLLEQFEAQGALALQSKARGPKTNYRRTEEMVRQIIRHRFLDPDASAEVIAQKLQQAHHLISIRSVERVISDFGLQKKNSTPVALKACPSKSRPSGPDANSAPNRAIRPALSVRLANCWPTKFPATKSESGSWLLSIFAWALGICSALGTRAADRLSGHAWLYTWSMRRLSVSTVYATSAP